MTRALALFGASLLCVAVVYHRAPMNLFRAESGLYLILSHADAQTQRGMERQFLRYSYFGHYTPLGFLAEFEFAEVAGTDGNIWRARQLAVLAIVGAAVFALGRVAGVMFGVSRAGAVMMAIALAATVVFQPAMAEFVGWPITVMQLIWMACAVVDLSALLRFAAAPGEVRWLWIATISAYGSMHFFGLGLVLVAATCMTSAGILFLQVRQQPALVRPNLRGIATALATMLCLAAMHAWAMAALQKPSEVARVAPHFSVATIKLLLGFLWHFGVAGGQSFLPTAAAQTSAESLTYAWPFGLILPPALLLAGAMLFRRADLQRTRETTSAFVLHCFSIAMFLTLALLIVLRSALEAASLPELADGLAYYTWIPRYLIPLHLALLGSATAVATLVARRMRRAAVVGFCALALGVSGSQMEFERSAFKVIAPRSAIAHDAAWQLILETVRECRAGGLPVPDMPLDVLTQELPGVAIHSTKPLLRADLKRAANDTVETIPWSAYLTSDRERYRGIGALTKLERELGFVPNESN